MKILFKTILLTAGLLLFLPITAKAADHHVSSISAANSAGSPGDTVYIRAGTYSTTLRPTRSGTAENPITFKPEGGDVILRSRGIDLGNRSYIIIDGFKIMNTGGEWVNFEPNGAYNIVKNCHMEESNAYHGILLKDGANYNKILNNTIIGRCGPDNLIKVQESHHNLTEGNKLYYGPHNGFTFKDEPARTTYYNIVRDNFIENKWHSNFNVNGSQNILIENNVIVDGGENAENNSCGTSRDREMPRFQHKGIQLSAVRSIVRNNILVNNGYGIELVPS